jgi:hypothetical protein
MSVWPEGVTPSPALRGTEGELVSVRIAIEPRLLEQALEALARLEFPINPQIYHDALTTVVEFPAWAGRLGEVREALRRNGFDPGTLTVRGMLEDIRAVA